MGTEAEAKKNMRRPAAHISLKVKVASAVGARDWQSVIKAYSQYGSYLELTGDDKPAEKMVVVTWPKEEN